MRPGMGLRRLCASEPGFVCGIARIQDGAAVLGFFISPRRACGRINPGRSSLNGVWGVWGVWAPEARAAPGWAPALGA